MRSILALAIAVGISQTPRPASTPGRDILVQRTNTSRPKAPKTDENPPIVKVSDQRILTVALIVAVLSGSLLWLRWLCLHSPEIPFLPRFAGAKWIVYPTPPQLRPIRKAPLPADFRRKFALTEVPQTAMLTVRAFGKLAVYVNDQPLPLERDASANWKEAIDYDVARLLRPGENVLEAVVIQEAGRPALWLRLDLDDEVIASDEMWHVNYAGATLLQAVSAEKPLRGGPLRIGPRIAMSDVESPTASEPAARLVERPERSVPALLAKLPMILGFALASGALASGLIYWQRRRAAAAGRPQTGFGRREAIWIFAVVATLWAVLAWNNQASLHRLSGADALHHLEYVDYILQNGSLPKPGDGMETHQPPLYYAVTAGVLWPLGVSTEDDSGIFAVRALTLLCGIGHLAFIFASLRLIFPDHPRRQFVGLVIAAFLPVHLFVFQYPTNETLTALLASASIYLALRILRAGDASAKWYLLLGLTLGAGMLSKTTTLVLLAVIPCVLAAQLIARRQYCPWKWAKTLGSVILVCGVVCGWYYWHIARDFGTPLVRNTDLVENWKDPGSHTARDFFRFGEVLTSPFFAGFNSFGDALYSTMWGDGRYGGSGSLLHRVPWKYELMAAGYLLALVPCVAVAVGALAALIAFVRRPSLLWLMLWGLCFTMAFAIIYENLRHPHMIVAKAWYALPVFVVVCAWGAWGFDVCFGRFPWSRLIGYMGLGAWALTAFASFWIQGDSAAVDAGLGYHYLAWKDYETSLKHYTDAVKKDPLDPHTQYGLGELLSRMGRFREARQSFQRAIELNPLDADAHSRLGHLMARSGENEQALRHLDTAIQLDPDMRSAHLWRAQLFYNLNVPDKTVESLREVIRIQPARGIPHLMIAEVYETHGNAAAARLHYQWAELLGMKRPRTVAP